MSISLYEPLDRDLIEAEMSAPARTQLNSLAILPETDSTNSALSRLPSEKQHRHAILAELQTGGRGRRARSWHSPAGGNIYLSLGWRFDRQELPLATLPLAVAVCVCRALEEIGLRGHGIKWPNDILVSGRKLAGILVEMQSSGNGPALAAIGVGLNIRMDRDADTDRAIEQPWTDLVSQLPNGGSRTRRNAVAACLLDALVNGMVEFEKGGFEVFRPAWQDNDLLIGKSVRLDHNGRQFTGIMRGIDRSGAAVIESGEGELKAWHSGEVSIRHG